MNEALVAAVIAAGFSIDGYGRELKEKPRVQRVRKQRCSPHQSVKEKARRVRQGKHLEFCQ